MSKTILANVDGFTPAIDGIVEELGFLTAIVFGVIWRYCQMEDGVCNASQEKLANKIGIKRQTLARHAKSLVAAGYLESELKEGIGITYKDTGKANLLLKVTGGVIKSDTGCYPELQVPVIKSDTKKVFKERFKESIYEPEIYFYRLVTGLLPDIMRYDEIIANIDSAFERRQKSYDEFETYMRGVYHNWCGTRAKDGRSYSPSNPKWIEWAISGRYLEDKPTTFKGEEGGYYA